MSRELKPPPPGYPNDDLMLDILRTAGWKVTLNKFSEDDEPVDKHEAKHPEFGTWSFLNIWWMYTIHLEKIGAKEVSYD